MGNPKDTKSASDKEKTKGTATVTAKVSQISNDKTSSDALALAAKLPNDWVVADLHIAFDERKVKMELTAFILKDHPVCVFIPNPKFIQNNAQIATAANDKPNAAQVSLHPRPNEIWLDRKKFTYFRFANDLPVKEESQEKILHIQIKFPKESMGFEDWFANLQEEIYGLKAFIKYFSENATISVLIGSMQVHMIESFFKHLTESQVLSSEASDFFKAIAISQRFISNQEKQDRLKIQDYIKKYEADRANGDYYELAIDIARTAHEGSIEESKKYGRILNDTNGYLDNSDIAWDLARQLTPLSAKHAILAYEILSFASPLYASALIEIVKIASKLWQERKGRLGIVESRKYLQKAIRAQYQLASNPYLRGFDQSTRDADLKTFLNLLEQYYSVEGTANDSQALSSRLDLKHNVQTISLVIPQIFLHIPIALASNLQAFRLGQETQLQLDILPHSAPKEQTTIQPLTKNAAALNFREKARLPKPRDWNVTTGDLSALEDRRYQDWVKYEKDQDVDAELALVMPLKVKISVVAITRKDIFKAPPPHSASQKKSENDTFFMVIEFQESQESDNDDRGLQSSEVDRLHIFLEDPSKRMSDIYANGNAETTIVVATGDMREHFAEGTGENSC